MLIEKEKKREKGTTEECNKNKRKKKKRKMRLKKNPKQCECAQNSNREETKKCWQRRMCKGILGSSCQ